MHVATFDQIFCTDCLQCWRDVCDTSPFIPDENFLTNCCDCVLEMDSENCLQNVSFAGSTPSECCNTAQSNLLFLFSADNEELSGVCDSSESFPFTRPENLRLVGNPSLLDPGVYVVPSFEFECSGCIEEVQMQGKIPGISGDASNSIFVTINLLTWSLLEADNDDDLHRLSRNVSVTSDNITSRDGADMSQLTLTFTLSETIQLCFEKNETLGFSFEASSNLQVILDSELGGPVYELSSSIADTCPNLGNLYTSTTASSDRLPLMAVRVSKFIHLCHICYTQRFWKLYMYSPSGPPLLPSSETLSPSLLVGTNTKTSVTLVPTAGPPLFPSSETLSPSLLVGTNTKTSVTLVPTAWPPLFPSSETLSPSLLVGTNTKTSVTLVPTAWPPLFPSSETLSPSLLVGTNTKTSVTLVPTPAQTTTTTVTVTTSSGVSSQLIIGIVCGLAAVIIIGCTLALVLAVIVKCNSRDNVDSESMLQQRFISSVTLTYVML